uniref:Uncharacterized protein n=1 Tax=Podarcis muralis TaxID=64176 RepID=A0A670KAW2_PODMU
HTVGNKQLRGRDMQAIPTQEGGASYWAGVSCRRPPPALPKPDAIPIPFQPGSGEEVMSREIREHVEQAVVMLEAPNDAKEQQRGFLALWSNGNLGKRV